MCLDRRRAVFSFRRKASRCAAAGCRKICDFVKSYEWDRRLEPISHFDVRPKQQALDDDVNYQYR
jgi:hypothetical protein